MKETKKEVTGHGPADPVKDQAMDSVKNQDDVGIKLSELIHNKDKAGIINLVLKSLEKKYKPTRGSYEIKFEAPNKASNFIIIINGSEIRFRIPNSTTAKSKFYPRNLLLSSKAFFKSSEGIDAFIDTYLAYKKNKWVISYDLLTSVRSKESTEDKAKSFSF